MSMIVLLDAGPLGMVINPRASAENDALNRWLETLLAQDIHVAVPEIADYEVRRELLLRNNAQSIGQLDALRIYLDFVPITSAIMLKAAEFWAEARKRGRPTADDKALDGDVILAAQAESLARGDNHVVVATTNVQHLGLFVEARLWRQIP